MSEGIAEPGIDRTGIDHLLRHPVPIGFIFQIVRVQPDRDPVQDYCYSIVDKNGVDWKIGDAYGAEFLDITLPHNFLFGDKYSKSTSSPIDGDGVLRFKVSENSGNGARQGKDGECTVVISSLRPDKTGAPRVFRVGETTDPTEKMDKR